MVSPGSSRAFVAALAAAIAILFFLPATAEAKPSSHSTHRVQRTHTTKTTHKRVVKHPWAKKSTAARSHARPRHASHPPKAHVKSTPARKKR